MGAARGPEAFLIFSLAGVGGTARSAVPKRAEVAARLPGAGRAFTFFADGARAAVLSTARTNGGAVEPVPDADDEVVIVSLQKFYHSAAGRRGTNNFGCDTPFQSLSELARTRR